MKCNRDNKFHFNLSDADRYMCDLAQSLAQPESSPYIEDTETKH